MKRKTLDVVQVVFWVAVLCMAFVMQVIPFLLILTMINIAVGISSTTMLVLLPAGHFGILFSACYLTERHRKRHWMKYVPVKPARAAPVQ